MSRLAVWIVMGVGSCVGAWAGINTADTAIAAVYFSGLALFCHWMTA
jgi:hypothetical protein